MLPRSTTPYRSRAALQEISPSAASSATRAAGRSSGSPHPPPPPVRTMPSEFIGTGMLAPVIHSNFFSPARLSRLPPGEPGIPPAMPQGGHLLRRVRSKFHRPSTRLRTRVSTPSPPRYLPAPQESCRSARLSTTTGHFSSMPSIDPLRTSPWHTDTVADSPSSNGRPPHPPPSMLCTMKRRLVLGCIRKNPPAPPRSQ